MLGPWNSRLYLVEDVGPRLQYLGGRSLLCRFLGWSCLIVKTIQDTDADCLYLEELFYKEKYEDI